MLSKNRSSFRYEVRVTTPHFQIATMEECGLHSSFHLNEDKPLPRYPALWRQKKSRYLTAPSKPVALLGTWTSRRGTLCSLGSAEEEEGEIPVFSNRAFHCRYTLEHNLTRAGLIGEDVPTWIDLLHDVHRVQAAYGKVDLVSSSPMESRDLAPICISSRFPLKRMYIR